MGVTKLYLRDTVLEAARDRVRWCYDNFDQVYVSFSGGKDSSVVLQLALEIAAEKKAGKVPVIFLDQEAEWGTVIDYIRVIMADPRVEPRWLQIPIRMNNAASIDEPWLFCWDPAKESQWLRPKEPIAFTENVYGTDIFKDLFANYMAYHHPRASVAALTGMRCQESPGRTLGLTRTDIWRGVSWGSQDSYRKHFHMSPVYDWAYTDVWKYLHEKQEAARALGDDRPLYCPLYDKMYQYGLPIQLMRVSNVTHELATRSLFFLQEIEPQTWNRLTARLGGINSVGQMQMGYYAPKDLPFMFKDWAEYRDYLLMTLTDDVGREYFAKHFPTMDRDYADAPEEIRLMCYQTQISAILRNDWEEGTGLATFRMTHPPPRLLRKKAAWRKATNDRMTDRRVVQV